MPRKRPGTPDQIEQDFLDALDRLKAGRPQNAKLREKVRNGKPIKINFSTVAQESGRARGLISEEICRYPKVRDMVKDAAEVPGAEPDNRADVFANFRAQISELKTQLATTRDSAARHFELRTKAESKADSFQKRYERLLAQNERKSDQVQPKVVALFPEKGDVGDAE